MCGRFNITPKKEVLSMLEAIETTGEPKFSSDIAPGAQISIIPSSRSIQTATWWLLLDPATLKPNYKYSSFNSRSDKLNLPRSIAYKPYRESRCIIPASAFVEGMGDKKTYHMIELVDQAIAFGGLYKEQINQNTGEIIFSASIITLPPIEKWSNIHPKSIPLMLDYNNNKLIDKWLDPDFSDVDEFNDLLKPEIHQTQSVTPIDRPSKWNPIGESFLIS
jgi:putative SOS response-associated peptidase YedK